MTINEAALEIMTCSRGIIIDISDFSPLQHLHHIN